MKNFTKSAEACEQCGFGIFIESHIKDRSALLLRHPFDGEPDQFASNLQAEFFFDVTAVCFNGLDAQVKGGCHLTRV